MINNLKQFLIISATILVFAFYFGLNHPVSSSSAENVSGYGWEASDSGGMGWLSFNCISGGNCSTSNYGVNINGTDVIGYAWTPNYGWIKFGGLSGFPSGPGTTSANAKLTGNTLTGWARFCSVLSDANCTGTTMKSNDQTGGWDGWVSLSGKGYNVAVNQSNGVFSGYAWGGPDVLGWINFNQVVTVPNNNNPLLYLKANGNTGYTTIGISGEVFLSSTGYQLKTTGGVASGEWSGNKTCPSSLTPPGTPYNPSFNHNTLGTYRYTLTCDKADNSGTISSFVDVVVVESIDFCIANPSDPTCAPTPPKQPKYIER
ncbi:hypothetical protein A3B84_01100 [Candidatus Nomurabacteria bacterium RIFCSPHIGHO2_02_FULL_35_13]|uniref:Uncharacterized protein n=1 Tax=Candidatus Nomurabacteria bacterium RIFCSPHIGHO2_02_FULL_35_13 TaxID=1801748 RepID=A0A1F6VQ21_9BACT|nr:MAG: hypothetical protein A3B84_01100 [Candidatus Nomurabacteria bacterium RIFCSPHIGHO2_02_FULL_35_13]